MGVPACLLDNGNGMENVMAIQDFEELSRESIKISVLGRTFGVVSRCPLHALNPGISFS